MKRMVVALSVLILISSTASLAQNRRFTFDAGGGFSPLVGNINNYLNNGWHATGGAGYNFSPAFSVAIDYTFHHFGISPRVLSAAQLSSGSSRLWSLTVDPKLTLRYVGRTRPYLVGGAGYYRRTVQVPQSAFLVGIGNQSTSAVGGSLGLGFNIGIRDSGLGMFTEIRYHYAPTSGEAIRMIPITLGVRW